MDPVGQISPDGKWWWNGKQWVSAASADGRWQWDGRNWVATSPVGSSRHTTRANSSIPGFRTGKVWKLPVIAFGFLLLLAGINSAASQPPSKPAGQGVAQVLTSPSPSMAASSQAPGSSASPSNTGPPSPAPSPLPSPSPTPVQAAPAPAPQNTCGASSNPWGYNFCGGHYITNPPGSFCSYFNCIPSFWTSTNGYVDQCVDGKYSHSGGRQGACSHHGGEARPLYGP